MWSGREQHWAGLRRLFEINCRAKWPIAAEDCEEMGGKGVKILRNVPVDYICESFPYFLELQKKDLSYSEQVFGY